MAKKQTLFFVFIGVLTLLELGLNVWFPTYIPPRINSIAQVSTGLIIGIAIIAFFYNKEVTRIAQKSSLIQLIFAASVAIVGGIVACLLLSKSFREVPIHHQTSDIIPSIRIAVQRLLAGDYPYRLITEYGWTLPLTYLPMQWMPFIPAEITHIDYRWTPLIIWSIAVVYLLKDIRNKGLSLLLFVVCLLIAIYFDPGIFTLTVELMVAGFYILFIRGLNDQRGWLKGIFFGICLMSRYSLVLWLPLWLFVEMFGHDKQALGRTGLVSIGFVLIIYVVPFLSQDPSIFMRAYNYYTEATYYEWDRWSEQGQPVYLYRGQALAWVFYEYFNNYTLADRIRSLQKAHFVFSLASVAVMGAWYWFKRAKINKYIFLMASFKIYLTVFLAFIQIPYPYLMITGYFVSVAILVEVMKYSSQILQIQVQYQDKPIVHTVG